MSQMMLFFLSFCNSFRPSTRSTTIRRYFHFFSTKDFLSKDHFCSNNSNMVYLFLFKCAYFLLYQVILDQWLKIAQLGVY